MRRCLVWRRGLYYYHAGSFLRVPRRLRFFVGAERRESGREKRQYAGRRQKRLHDPATWSNASHIMLLRQRALARVFVRGVQRWPVFYAFEEAVRFCVKAYNSSMSYILLWGGRERESMSRSTGHMQRSKLHFESLTSKSAVAKSKSASEMCAGQSAPQSPTG